MRDPVLLCDGSTYDREAIEDWLQKNDTSPMTGTTLESKELRTNLYIKNLIDKLKL